MRDEDEAELSKQQEEAGPEIITDLNPQVSCEIHK